MSDIKFGNNNIHEFCRPKSEHIMWICDPVPPKISSVVSLCLPSQSRRATKDLTNEVAKMSAHEPPQSINSTCDDSSFDSAIWRCVKSIELCC
jgi:hypothetical protein